MKKTHTKPRKLKDSIRLRLTTQMPVADIARELQCERSLVRWHAMRMKLIDQPVFQRDLLQEKINRFVKRYPLYAGMDKTTLKNLTDFKCAFSRQLVDTQKDNYCIGILDVMPILYFSKYRILACFIEQLRKTGWTIKAP